MGSEGFPPPGDDSNAGDAVANGAKRRPRPRKGHTKSRRGCLTCKRRRVKCPETLPECDNCARLGLACVYPTAKALVPVPGPSTNLSSSVMPSLSPSPTPLALEDLRFFHHFLFTAYPPLPIGGKAIWRDMAALSHSFDFLVHAVLGLSASHLTLAHRSRVDYSAQALSHRVQSINALNHALSRPCLSKAEGDARFATLMALTFQSSYMADGMADFLTMIRGCTVVQYSGMPSFSESVFQGFTLEAHQESVRCINEGRPYASDQRLAGFATGGLDSLAAIRPLCPEGSAERTYLNALEGVLELTRVTPLQGFTTLCVMYALLDDFDNESFARFIDPSSAVAQVLLAHFFLIETKVGHLCLESIIESFPFKGAIVDAWVRKVANALPADFRLYMSWPLSEAASIAAVGPDPGPGPGFGSRGSTSRTTSLLLEMPLLEQ